MTSTDLAAAERVRPQSLTRVLADLETEDLIRRRPGEADRRQIFLELTERGAQALERDMARRDRWLAAAMEQSLTPTERGLLRLAAQVMERLAEAEIDPSEELQ
jgi:DNA-binding MarR family transcriptional regulator